MPAAESTIVFLPRFTTLSVIEATTQPLDVSQFASAQFQVWRGVDVNSQLGTRMTVYLEESLDAEHWSLGASAPKGYVIKSEQAKLFSYGFRLRWFRLRVALETEIEPGTFLPGGTLTCWAEGILR